MKAVCLLSGLALLIGSASIFAFDSQTHAYITYQAFVNSNLDNANAATLLLQLGLDRFDATQPFSPYWVAAPFPESFYFDNLPSSATPLQYERPVTAYEWYQMQQLVNTGVVSNTAIGATAIQTLPIVNWLMRGAIREDDLAPSQYDPRDGAPPDQDPYLAFNRVYNHFYDPINNRKLTYTANPLVQCPTGLPDTGGFCYKSVDWALGTVDAFASLAPDPNRHQHFSWEDARQNEFLALTAERDANSDGMRDASEREADSEERMFRWATTFRSIGDVVHLLQDAAQPQHTRNDRHDPHVTPIDQQGFEPFTNYRLIGADALAGAEPTLGQQYVRSLVGNTSKIFNQFFTPLPGIDGYQIPMFATPLRFFTTRNPGDGPSVLPDNRYGMADYSNRGFFTRGTLPDSNTLLPGVFSYPEPDPAQLTFQKSNCAFLPIIFGVGVNCKTGYHVVPDPFQPARSDVTTPEPLVTAGIWLDFGSSSIANVGYTLTPQTYQMMGNLTVPRAIAYSAGLIDYFFRGQIAITPPPAGIYAIFDHSQTHTVDADGYPRDTNGNIFGFTQVQMNVLNATAPITESGSGITVNQRMTNGELVAVARYHRNKCYQPDLSGEIAEDYDTGQMHPPASCDVIANRTPYQEISVSAPLSVDAGGDVTVSGQPYDLNGTTPILALFDFSADPIPINATDLFLQVVYRGNMGDTVGGTPMIEPDAIAVGTVDVSEPTYGAVFDEDYFLYYSQWLTAAQAQSQVPPGTNVNPAPLVNVQYCIDDHLVGEKGLTNQPAGGLQPARQIRYAAILDISQAHTHTDIAQFWINNQPDTQVLIGNAPVFQRDAQASMEQDPLSGPGAYAPDAQTWGRGVVLGSWETSFYQGYYPYIVTYFPQNAPLPNGFLPDPSDAVYLNHPDAALCNQQGTRPMQLRAGGRNTSAMAH